MKKGVISRLKIVGFCFLFLFSMTVVSGCKDKKVKSVDKANNEVFFDSEDTVDSTEQSAEKMDAQESEKQEGKTQNQTSTDYELKHEEREEHEEQISTEQESWTEYY